MFRLPLLQHVLVMLGYALMCFWIARQERPSNSTFLFIGLLCCFVATALVEVGGRFREYEGRIRKLEEEMKGQQPYVP